MFWDEIEIIKININKINEIDEINETDEADEIEKVQPKTEYLIIKMNRRGNADTTITTVFWCGVE